MLKTKNKQRYKHAVVINCGLCDMYEREKNGWEICGVNGCVPYPNPTIYFKRPYEETDEESSKQP